MNDKLKILKLALPAVEILLSRFGHKTTIAEIYSTMLVEQALLEGRPITLSQVAAASGTPKQTVSARAARRTDITLEPNPLDEREKHIHCNGDLETSTDYLFEILDAFRWIQINQGFVREEELVVTMTQALRRHKRRTKKSRRRTPG